MLPLFLSLISSASKISFYFFGDICTVRAGFLEEQMEHTLLRLFLSAGASLFIRISLQLKSYSKGKTYISVSGMVASAKPQEILEYI